ncbi:MAG: DUF1461 domain-containing protein [Clostridia bacterium]|nr:DUF1461 domain-containing protein [Clostridia bacterium]
MKVLSEKSQRVISRLIGVLTTIGVFLLCGFIAIIVPATSRAFYNHQFNKNDTLNKVHQQSYYLSGEAKTYVANLTLDELLSLMDHTMEYCLYFEDDLNIVVDGNYLEVFRPDEYEHMRDVKKVFGGGMVLVGVGVLFIVVGVVFNLKFRSIYLKYAKKTPFYTLAVILGLLLLIALFAVIDFDTAFTIFHQIFFYGKQWTFSSGVMVAMIADIFTGLAPIILLVWVALLGAYITAVYFYNKALKKRLIKNLD